MPCEKCLRAYMDSEGPDQPAHQCSLIRAFTVHYQSFPNKECIESKDSNDSLLMCRRIWIYAHVGRHFFAWHGHLGPVVQSVVSLTSLLRVILLTVLADSIHNILLFFAEKMWVAFALQSYSHFFSKKFQYICVSLDVNFNESLTNDVVSFEQLGPDLLCTFVFFGW